MSAFDSYVQAKFHGGTMAGGPTFTVVHDAETPLRVGYADSIADFFRRGPKAGTSAHAMVGPEKAIKLLPDNVVAYAAGPKANPLGWHLEQTGYARFTRPEWTTADGYAQLHRVGACLREVHDQWGIPKRWCTDDQLRRAADGDRASGGMTTHQQVARVLRGTTHTDPEERYPRDLLLLQLVQGGVADAPAPVIDLRGLEEMRVLVDNKGTIHLDTGYELQATGSLALAELWQRRYGAAIPHTEGEVGVIRDDNRARLNRLTSALAKANGTDVTALGQAIVSGLLPQLTEVLATKTGATRDEVDDAIRDFFAAAVAVG